MASKGVLDRQRIARSIVATGRTHAEEVGEKLQEILSSTGREGAQAPDMVELQLLLADHLETRIQEGIAADEAHLRELRDDDLPRRLRDEAASGLYSALTGIREAIVSGFGQENVKALLGYDGVTPTDPLRLHRLAGRALDLLRAPDAAIPPPRFGGVAIDLAALADELQPALEGLSEALVQVDNELRETESTLRLKDTTLNDLDAAIGGVGRILIGCDELAGFPEYGEKIRLTLPFRRRRTTATEETPSGEGDPAPTEPTGATEGAGEEGSESGSESPNA